LLRNCRRNSEFWNLIIGPSPSLLQLKTLMRCKYFSFVHFYFKNFGFKCLIAE